MHFHRAMRIVLIILSSLILAFIWLNSLFSAEISQKISNMVQKILGIESTQHAVRKTGHFPFLACEYRHQADKGSRFLPVLFCDIRSVDGRNDSIVQSRQKRRSQGYLDRHRRVFGRVCCGNCIIADFRFHFKSQFENKNNERSYKIWRIAYRIYGR